MTLERRNYRRRALSLLQPSFLFLFHKACNASTRAVSLSLRFSAFGGLLCRWTQWRRTTPKCQKVTSAKMLGPLTSWLTWLSDTFHLGWTDVGSYFYTINMYIHLSCSVQNSSQVCRFTRMALYKDDDGDHCYYYCWLLLCQDIFSEMICCVLIGTICFFHLSLHACTIHCRFSSFKVHSACSGFLYIMRPLNVLSDTTNASVCSNKSCIMKWIMQWNIPKHSDRDCYCWRTRQTTVCASCCVWLRVRTPHQVVINCVNTS